MSSTKRPYNPPKAATSFLRWFCKEGLVEEIEGDLYEYYQLYAQKNPRWKANIYYWSHLISFLRQYSLKKKTQNSKYIIMFSNYFKFSIRYFRKHPLSAFLNALSLSIGIACFLFIFIYVNGEFSYDKYHQDADRIYRVVIDLVKNGERLPDATTPPALAPTLKATLPEVEEATRIFPSWGVKYLMGVTPEQQFYEDGVYRVDPNFLEVFSFKAIQGDPKTMLDDPSKVVLTESMAKKYFGNEDPMGQEITFFDRDPMNKVVSGIIEDVPFNSHFDFDFLIPLHFEDRNIDEIWGWYNYYTYVKLKEDAVHDVFEEKLQPLYLSNNPADTISPNITYSQPVSDIHLKSELKWELGTNNTLSNIRIFVSVGLFILIISLINYLNLTIGNMSQRVKEAGVRRTFGARKISLIHQFITESVIIVLCSIFFGVLLAEIALSQMELLFGRAISVFDIENLRALLVLTILAIGMGVLAGVYPAIYFSSLGKSENVISFKREGRFDIKKMLLVAQFAISSIMIVGTLVVYKQLNYFKNADMGFNPDQVLIIENIGSLSDPQVLLEEVNKLSFVEAAGFSNGVVGGLNWTTSIGYPDQFLLNYAVIYPGYMDVMEFEFIAGRNFDSAIESDRQGWNFILNESALAQLHIPLEKVGESVVVTSSQDSLIYGKVIGVVKDFHFTDFKSAIKPYCFFYRENVTNNLALRMDVAKMSANLQALEDVWNNVAEGVPFETYFLDQAFFKLHEVEERLSSVMLSLTFLSVFIAFIGMLSIVNIAVKGRLKEVAVRKVLGATTPQVVNLFTKRFLLLVLIANIIGLPLAYLTMKGWLADFAYRTTMDPMVFLLAMISTIGVAYLIIGIRSLKVANSNLTNRLSDE